MKTNSLLLVTTLAALLGIANSPAQAQGAAAAKAATEILEQLGKRAGGQAAKELEAFGGEAVVRALLQQAEKEGGEQLLSVISRQVSEHGWLALRAMQGAPKLVSEAVEQLPKELAERGLLAISRNPQAIQQVIQTAGREGLEAAAKHPGVGLQIAQKLGREGADAARTLTDDAAAVMARHADDIAKLPPAERTGLLNAFKQMPAKTVKFLGKHPVGTLTAAFVISFLANPDAYLGTADKPGFIERIAKEPVKLIGTVLATLLGIWGAMKLFFAWRIMRRKAAAP